MVEELKAGRYKILQKIDEGGMGVVYHAYDTRLQCPVALKEIKPVLLDDPQFRHRLAREAHAAAAINHPGIARAMDFVDDGTDCFIVYEFVQGVDLHKLLNQRRFSIDEILDVGIKLADALAAAHAHGFIHRDIKPKNIMLIPRPDARSRVKILDFGLAKQSKVVALARQGQTGETSSESYTTTGMAIIGTPDYMSPEQAAAEPVDARTDLFALGLVLYEMAAGFNPFTGHNAASTLARILTLDPPPLPERIPLAPENLELDRITHKCLRKLADERYASAGELLADLVKLRDGPIAPPRPPGGFVPRWLACVLFSLIQIGYLAMYAVAFAYLPENAHRLPMAFLGYDVTKFVVATLTMLSGAATVRLYFLAAVAFDYEDFGRLFHRLFPGLLIVDLAWAISPLLLFQKLGYILLLCVPALACLPFSQRTLVSFAYRRRGGRSSAAGAASPAQLRTD